MILLDTHALLWWKAGGTRLSERAAREIARAETLLVSPISCWEIATLRRLGRIDLDRETHAWFRDLFTAERVEEALLSSHAAIDAAELVKEGFHGDPADGFLYATAREHLVPLLTKDERIARFASQSGDVRVVW